MEKLQERLKQRMSIMKVKVLLLLIGFGLLVSFSLPAWSQEKEEEADFTAYDLGEIVVSGEHPAAVTEMAITNEVTAEQIKATHSTNVAEAESLVVAFLVMMLITPPKPPAP